MHKSVQPKVRPKAKLLIETINAITAAFKPCFFHKPDQYLKVLQLHPPIYELNIPSSCPFNSVRFYPFL